MTDFSPRRMQVRLLMLVLLAALPALVITTLTARETRERERSQAEAEVSRLADLAASSLTPVFESAQQFLYAVTRLPEVRTLRPAACSRVLADLLDRLGGYANVGIIGADGYLACSAVPAPQRLDLRDRSYFRLAVATRRFAVGEYQVSRVTGKPTINVAEPLLGRGGRVEGVAFAALDLGYLGRILARVDVPSGGAVSLVDRNGTVLARLPDPERFVGRAQPEVPIVRRVLALRQGRTESVGLDGVRRLYGFAPVGNNGPFVTVGLAKAEVLRSANQTATRNLLLLTAAALLALAAAWFVGKALVVRPLETAFAREQDAVQQLRSGDEMKNAILRAVSHDLRSPLTAVSGFAHLLARPDRSEDPQRVGDLANRIVNGAARMERLITDLLDLDRLTRGDVAPNRTATNVTAIAHATVERLALDEHAVAVSEEPVVANVDGKHVERVLENLISNAAKYSPRGSEISVRVGRARDAVELIVDDAGPGITDDMKKAVFEPFRRGADQHHTPGTGIGLSLVAQFARAHGGRAWVEDAPSGGASFHVLLPDGEGPDGEGPDGEGPDGEGPDGEAMAGG